ncbi:MAG: serine/threonine protein kinase [Desulfobacterales bacterium]|nr:serine/threonine protein kinase [Desulfobacterales bacterium]
MIDKEIINNKKILAVFILIWFSACGIGYSLYSSAVKKGEKKIDQFCQDATEHFKQAGLSETQNLAEKTSSFIPLAKKIEAMKLEIIKAVEDVSGIENLKFAAVTDSDSIILDHTDHKLAGKHFSPLQLKHEKPLDKVDTVSIQTGISDENGIAVNFSSDVIFANNKVGNVYLTFHQQNPQVNDILSSRSKYRILLICWMVIIFPLISLLFLALISFGLKYRRMQNQKREKEYSELDQIGPYKLQKRIGIGGMAEVYLADHIIGKDITRTVALKKVLPNLIENKEFVDMFIREARLSMKLDHPNIVRTTDFREDQYSIIMEHINGGHLAEIMKAYQEHYPNKGLPFAQAVYIILNTCMGLQYAHSLDIIHRDISPQNIMISFQGEVKIADFGIAKALSEPSFTQAGLFKGKYCYISPEQAMGKKNDHLSDIYSLGIIFYELLSGRRMYAYKTDIEAIRNIPAKKIAPIKGVMTDMPDETDVLDELDRIVMKCLAKDREQRYKSAVDFLADLKELRQNYTVTYDMSLLQDFMEKYFKKNKKVQSQ